MKTISIYIHIPFCKSKCIYCDFNSFPNKEDLIDSYIGALLKEIQSYKSKLVEYKVLTIYIGGGTPTFINYKHIKQIMANLYKYFNIDEFAEITIEGNPGTFSKDKLLAYKSVGINRLSIGLQAWQNELLRYLGRIHTREQFIETYYLAREMEFNNINIDLMFGLPGQNINQWIETLNNVILLEPQHLSCYSLKIEDKTPLGEQYNKGLFEIDDVLDRDMYYYTINKLKEKKYRHYEISNFAKEYYESKHNLVYWELKPYIGLGAGAHSYFNYNRFNNTENIEQYIKQINKTQNVVKTNHLLTKKERMEEYIFLGLRKISGISIYDFKNIFNIDILDLYKNQIKELIDLELITVDKDKIYLTFKGLDYANFVFQSFL